jgi:pyruvate dehydrogenase E2 component (dihydrolipoamide acetyltransferase)
VADAAAGELPPASQTPTRLIRMAGMRSTIAKRMHASLREMAQLTLTMDADMTAVVADRARRKKEGVTIGFTDYVVAAAARALLQHPNVNSQITADGIAVLPDIHVGLAVALDDGLMVPVVRHTDRLDLPALSSETTRLADAARSGSLKLDELEGGTFSVSALGMFGVDVFTPVINPPNVAILGVGRLRDDVTVADGEIGTTKRLTLSLTWDHRVLDGAPAAAFCKTITDLLTDPAALDQFTRPAGS